MKNNKLQSEDNLIASLTFKFLPFWPLFAALLVVSGIGAWAYLKYYATPSYGISASLIIKDKEKGVNASKITESIDAFQSSTIVENEINVLRSRALMNQIVHQLNLYAPIYEEGNFKPLLAYSTSPIAISHKNPDQLTEQEAVYFTYDKKQKRVTIDSKSYQLGKWVETPYGPLKFEENPKQLTNPTGPLYFSLLDPKKLAGSLGSNILIETQGKLSSVVTLYVEDKVPQRGEDILNSLIRAYQQAAVDERNLLVTQTLTFVEDRIKLMEEELEALEKQIVQYKSTEGAVNLNEQGKQFLQNVGDIDRRMSEINLQLSVLDNLENYVVAKEKSAGSVPSTLGLTDPVLTQLIQKLYDSEIQYQQLRKTTAENNPMLLTLNEEIESIKPRILENIRNQRNNLRASQAKLTSINNSYNSVLQSIPKKERELLEISRQQAIKNEAYSFLLQKREETVLSYAPTAEEIRVVDTAKSTADPISPKPLYVYLSAIVLALSAGVMLITAKELLHNNVLFRSEIESCTNTPIVAELSTVKNPNVLMDSSHVAQIEQFRQLRVTMGLYGRSMSKRKIVITSSIPGEGKSYVSSNLAISLASSGKRTILLDFDLRNPKASVMLNIIDQRGIIEMLQGEVTPADIIYNTEFPNLSFMPAGLNIGDHTELLLSPQMEALFSFLENNFDYVIIDTPPLDLVSDAYLLSEYSDITLLVIRHAYTPKNIIQRLPHNNKLTMLQNAAIVFNGVKPRGFASGKYGYGYGYGYESKYGDKTYKVRKPTANTARV